MEEVKAPQVLDGAMGESSNLQLLEVSQCSALWVPKLLIVLR